MLSPGPKTLQPSNTTQAQASIATQIALPAVASMGAGAAISAAGTGAAASITTPYAVEVQGASAEAQATLSQVQGGATLYRTGELGTSMTGESQYWSLQNPLSYSNYASGVGAPGVTPDFVMSGTLNPGASVVTNAAPGLGSNAGGAIQVVTNPGGVGNLWFGSYP
jgi:hypothetical protein